MLFYYFKIWMVSELKLRAPKVEVKTFQLPASPKSHRIYEFWGLKAIITRPRLLCLSLFIHFWTFCSFILFHLFIYLFIQLLIKSSNNIYFKTIISQEDGIFCWKFWKEHMEFLPRLLMYCTSKRYLIVKQIMHQSSLKTSHKKWKFCFWSHV